MTLTSDRSALLEQSRRPGNVTQVSWRLPEVERMLVGQRITEEPVIPAGGGGEPQLNTFDKWLKIRSRKVCSPHTARNRLTQLIDRSHSATVRPGTWRPAPGTPAQSGGGG